MHRPSRGHHRSRASAPSFDPKGGDSRNRPNRPPTSRFQNPTYRPTSHQTQVQPEKNGEIRLITNAYNLKTSTSEIPIYEYRLKITLSRGSRDIPERVLNRNVVSSHLRNLILHLIQPNLRLPANQTVVMDMTLETLYSATKFIPIEGSVDASELEFLQIPVVSDLINLFHVDIKIRFARDLHLTVDHHNLLTAILHHQLKATMIRFGSVYFAPQDTHIDRQIDRLDLLSKLSMGISISGVRKSTNEGTLVVINCPYAYLTGSHRLIDLLASFVYGRPIDDIGLNHNPAYQENLRPCEQLTNLSPRDTLLDEFKTKLTGFKCIGLFLESRLNLRFDLTEESASELLIMTTDSRSFTIAEYFHAMGINLNYPNLPCLESNSTQYPFVPLELCFLVSGQKVPLFRLGINAKNDLSFKNKPKPEESFTYTNTARDQVESINRNQLRSFGVEISKEPIHALGSSLPRPILKFANTSFMPIRDFWESGRFYNPMHLNGDWIVVDTCGVDGNRIDNFFRGFHDYTSRYGFNLGQPYVICRSKQQILDFSDAVEELIEESMKKTNNKVKLIMFIIDSSSTSLNRLIHLKFDEHPQVAAACLRGDSINNERLHRSIFRTLIHKLNTRLGGTNVIFDDRTLGNLQINSSDLMIIGLDVTHPDNELSGVSIVGCAYTYSLDLFKHRSLAWPQEARVEIIGRMDALISRLLREYHSYNKMKLPANVIIYRDGVSHEEFERVREIEISKVVEVLDELAKETKCAKPKLSYIIAQKRHTMRFFNFSADQRVINPPGGTIIDKHIVSNDKYEFYLYSNTSPLATARPIHYYVLTDELGVERLQKLTYYLCFNFGRCSGSLSMPSSLRYAHNAAYEARNRVIASREFSATRFYSSKFFC